MGEDVEMREVKQEASSLWAEEGGDASLKSKKIKDVFIVDYEFALK